MSSCYIALLGNFGEDARSRLRADRSFLVLRDNPRLLVACAPGTERSDVGGDRGLVLGTLFESRADMPAPLARLDDHAARSALESDGASLADDFWGSYVAFLAREDGGTSVVRDPSGATACYWASVAGGTIVTSSVRACLALGLIQAEIDWGAVSAHLLWPERRNERTCIASVRELMPGCRLAVQHGGISMDAVWRPWKFAAAELRIGDATEAAERIRAAVIKTVGAWCRRYPRPLVSLSGGLDSSILMASTTGAAGAITFITHEPLGDERSYARAVAERCSVGLLEKELGAASITPRRSHAMALPRPVARMFAQELDRLWCCAAVDTGAGALFHGGGGDNVFCYLASGAPYLDSLLARLPGGERRAVCESLSQMTRVSSWRIRWAALRKAIADGGRYRWFRNARMLSREAIELGRRLAPHPWFAGIPRKTLPGKQAHVAALVRIQNYLEAIEPQQPVPVVAPLMSQPVVETCLRVPTWLWCRGGMNRVVARDAFRDLLPPSVIDRRSKGSPAAFDAQIVATKRRELLDLLGHGHLASRGLIDLGTVGRALGDSGPLRGDGYLRVTELVDVEAWLQSWIGVPSVPGFAQS